MLIEEKRDNIKTNFFIIGAPKCGTTSLSNWLEEHPNIYMSPVKEPHFFNTDLKYIKTPTRSKYKELFYNVSEKHLAIGEASVFYLFSKDAVPNIERELSGNARYIVMVRNPIYMAYSLHEQQLFSGNEHIKEFGKAWKLSGERIRGRSVTWWCRDPLLLSYSHVCSLGEQINRLFRIVPRERVLVLVLDDVKDNARREYIKVLDFLGLQDDGRQSFPVHNQAKERQWFGLRRTIQVMNHLKRNLNIPRLGTGLMKSIDKLNMKVRYREALSIELREELANYFRKDIELLERLLERDLSHWIDS